MSHCTVTNYDDWSTCSRSCGTGIMTRTREVQQGQQNGGTECPPLTDARTCNTDPNSVDACASWRLGTIDMLYQNRAHARLSTGEQSHFAATGMKKLIREEFCLPRDVKQSFASHRPAKGERYPISRLKPYTFGTDPQQTEQQRWFAMRGIRSSQSQLAQETGMVGIEFGFSTRCTGSV